MTNLHFEVQEKCGQRADDRRSMVLPSRFPCFVLNFNFDWNDYGYYTWFALFYVDRDKRKQLIGELKIMHDIEHFTYDEIPHSFESLGKDFCSLGIDDSYYARMRRMFSVEECKEILLALQDCSIQIEHYEKFKDYDGFKTSLIRDLSSEQVLREAKYIINDIPHKDAYFVNYTFHPYYNENSSTCFDINFTPKDKGYSRCSCVIGENGVGKTTMLSSLIDDLTNDNTEAFNGKLPIFSCVMSICTTPFDSFANLNRNSISPVLPYYYYCADQNSDRIIGDVKKSMEVLCRRMKRGISLFDRYETMLQDNFPDYSDYNLWDYDNENDKRIVKVEALKEFLKCLSSGQLQLFLLATFIYKQISLDSLVIIDEPELHLHPKAIRDLFKMLIEMLDEFESYCIVSTHSPLIVRELPSKNVYLMRRTDNMPMIVKADFETLGENISILYQKIFRYSDDNTNLGSYIRWMKNKGMNYDQIISKLMESGQNVGVNTRFIVKEIMDYEKSE